MVQGPSAKDIDGAMKPIAEDIVSYEHEAPLQYVGIQNVRAVCQRGLGIEPHERETGRRCRNRELVARTRIFRKIAGEWKMIHQHESFPYEPQQGKSAMDLRP
jgi:hypothetical protein